MSPETLTGVVLIGLAFAGGFAFGRYYPWLVHEVGSRPLRRQPDQTERLQRLHARWEQERDGDDQGRSGLTYHGTDCWRKR